MCSYPKCARSKSSSALIRQMRGGTNNSVRIKPTPERKARLHLNELMNSPKIAGVTDDAADTISYQRMSRLNCHQAAESSAQHKHWPDPQCTSSSGEYDTEPANRVTVNRPQLFAIGVCRQIRVDQSDYHQDGNDPAVAAGLAHTGAEISASEKRQTGKRKEHCHGRDQRRVREERPKPSPTKNGQHKRRSRSQWTLIEEPGSSLLLFCDDPITQLNVTAKVSP